MAEPEYKTAKGIPLNELENYKFLYAGESCTFRRMEGTTIVFVDADGKEQRAHQSQLDSILLLPLTPVQS